MLSWTENKPILKYKIINILTLIPLAFCMNISILCRSILYKNWLYLWKLHYQSSQLWQWNCIHIYELIFCVSSLFEEGVYEESTSFWSVCMRGSLWGPPDPGVPRWGTLAPIWNNTTFINTSQGHSLRVTLIRNHGRIDWALSRTSFCRDSREMESTIGYTFTPFGIFYFPWHRHQVEWTTAPH